MSRKSKRITGNSLEHTNRSGIAQWYSGGNLILQTLLPKLLTFAALGMLVLAGCNEDKILTGSLEVNFSLSKLDGTPGETFRSGEQFIVRLAITNLTGETRSYSYTPPNSVFRISHGDSVMITSVDGYAFPQVVLGVSIKPGETATYQWLAPTSGTYPQGIILPPGRYQATGQTHLLLDKYSPASQVVREFTIVAQ